MDYHHGNLKESILQVGEEYLRDQEVSELSFRAIAQKIGVSHNAPYRHFESKAELIEQIIQRELLSWVDQIQNSQLLYQQSILLQLQFSGRLYGQLAVRHPRKAHLVMAGPYMPESLGSSSRASHRLIVQVVSGLIQNATQSEIVANAPIDFIATQLIAYFRGICLMFISNIDIENLATESLLFEMLDSGTENIIRGYFRTESE